MSCLTKYPRFPLHCNVVEFFPEFSSKISMAKQLMQMQFPPSHIESFEIFSFFRSYVLPSCQKWNVRTFHFKHYSNYIMKDANWNNQFAAIPATIPPIVWLMIAFPVSLLHFKLDIIAT